MTRRVILLPDPPSQTLTGVLPSNAAWNRQPNETSLALNTKSPLAKNCKVLVTRGDWFNIVNRDRGWLFAGSEGTVITSSGIGSAVGGACPSRGYATYYSSGSWTIMLLIRNVTSWGSGTPAILYNSNGGNTDKSLSLRWAGSNYAFRGAVWNGSSMIDINGNVNAEDKLLHDVVLSCGGGTMQMYTDGVLEGQVSPGGSLPNGLTNYPYWMVGPGSSPATGSGAILLAGVFEGVVWGASEAKLLHANPWQLIAPRSASRRLYFGSGEEPVSYRPQSIRTVQAPHDVARHFGV